MTVKGETLKTEYSGWLRQVANGFRVYLTHVVTHGMFDLVAQPTQTSNHAAVYMYVGWTSNHATVR